MVCSGCLIDIKNIILTIIVIFIIIVTIIITALGSEAASTASSSSADLFLLASPAELGMFIYGIA